VQGERDAVIPGTRSAVPARSPAARERLDKETALARIRFSGSRMAIALPVALALFAGQAAGGSILAPEPARCAAAR
jgi:hypothetical protein